MFIQDLNSPDRYDSIKWGWMWDAQGWERLGAEYALRPYWPIIFIEQAAILLLGGGLLTFMVRRNRRCRADTGWA